MAEDLQCVWKYTARVSESRQATLASPGSFDRMLQLVTEEACDISVRYEPGRDKDLKLCGQVVFTLELPNCGDAFFNGPHGYRAQYYSSPHLGLASNGRIIEALSPKLMLALEQTHDARSKGIDGPLSLRAASAKIWIKEFDSDYRDLNADLAVKRWVDAVENGEGIEEIVSGTSRKNIRGERRSHKSLWS